MGVICNIHSRWMVCVLCLGFVLGFIRREKEMGLFGSIYGIALIFMFCVGFMVGYGFGRWVK